MKKLITIMMLILAFNFTGCSTPDEINIEEPVIVNPQEPVTPILVSGCYYIHYVNHTSVYHYTKRIYGNPTTYMLTYTSPLPQDQLDRWICP